MLVLRVHSNPDGEYKSPSCLFNYFEIIPWLWSLWPRELWLLQYIPSLLRVVWETPFSAVNISSWNIYIYICITVYFIDYSSLLILRGAELCCRSFYSLSLAGLTFISSTQTPSSAVLKRWPNLVREEKVTNINNRLAGWEEYKWHCALAQGFSCVHRRKSNLCIG